MSDYWTFGAVQFRRLVGGTDEPQWFPRTLARTVAVIADSSRRIIDRGATEFAPLAFTAWCDTLAAAQALEALYATQATLTSPTGRTSTALLTQADAPIYDGATWRVAVEFEVVS